VIGTIRKVWEAERVGRWILVRKW